MCYEQMIEKFGEHACDYKERDAPLANRNALTLLIECNVIVSSVEIGIRD